MPIDSGATYDSIKQDEAVIAAREMQQETLRRHMREEKMKAAIYASMIKIVFVFTRLRHFRRRIYDKFKRQLQSVCSAGLILFFVGFV